MNFLLILTIMLAPALHTGKQLIPSDMYDDPPPPAPSRPYTPPAPVRTEPSAGSVSSGPLSDKEFVTIPSGTFMMGSSPSEVDRDERVSSPHSVSISSFQLMTTEVTQGMWEAVMGTDVRYYRDLANPDWLLYGEGSKYPMYYVSWNDCQEFIEKLNSIYTEYIYRLPSESEWEYACCADTRTRFYWGDSDSESTMKQYCWYKNNADSPDWTSPHASQEGTQPVGTKTPNSWGLYDMSGNVWEWCEDTWHNCYDGAPTDGSAWVSSGASSCVLRGGGWNFNTGSCRSANRNNSGAGFRYNFLGFRLARSVR